MNYVRPLTNGNGYLAVHPASIVRAIRGELPPEPGERWLLVEDACNAEIKTSHPVLGTKRYELEVVAGSISGLDDGQLELAMEIGCAHAGGQSTGVLFRSTSLTRPDSFRYLAKGALHVGDASGIAVLRIHDLSWIVRRRPITDTRILTISAVVDKQYWGAPANGLPAPWLTRNSAEVFIHTEWRADRGPGTAA